MPLVNGCRQRRVVQQALVQNIALTLNDVTKTQKNKLGHQTEILQIYNTTGWARKKRSTLLLSISLPIIVRLSKFLHWHTLQTICNNAIIIDPTTCKCVSTLPCEISMKYAYITIITNKHFGKIEKTLDQHCSEWSV